MIRGNTDWCRALRIDWKLRDEKELAVVESPVACYIERLLSSVVRVLLRRPYPALPLFGFGGVEIFGRFF